MILAIAFLSGIILGLLVGSLLAYRLYCMSAGRGVNLTLHWLAHHGVIGYTEHPPHRPVPTETGFRA